MKPTLYVMCGVPGSGKTTYAHEHFSELPIISRDIIRFNMIKHDESYFSHEKEVFRQFVDEIVFQLRLGQSVVADATHLTIRSRRKLLTAIDKSIKNYSLVYVVMMTPERECLKRNAERKGLSHVPEHVITDASENFECPYLEEDERISTIFFA